MAIISRDELLKGTAVGQERAQIGPTAHKEIGDAPSFGTTIGAAFRQENTIASFLESDKESFIKDPSFDPISAIEGTAYEDNADSFIYADSEEEVQFVKNRIDKQNQDRDILRRSGWVGIVPMMVAGVLDPMVLIPGTAAFKAVSTGVKIAKGAAFGATTGVGVGAASELALQATQDVRTTRESLTIVAAGGILGGVLGGAIAGLSKGTRKIVQEELESVISKTAPKPVDLSEILAPRSAGARAATLSTAEEGLAHIGKVGGAGEKFVRHSVPVFKTPLTDGLTSPSAQMRRFTTDFYQHNFILGKNVKGLPTSTALESLMKLDAADIGAFQLQARSSYLKYAGLEGKAFKNIRGSIAPLRSKDKLSYKAFYEEVGKAMRRGDKHSIAEVQEIAQVARKRIDKVFKELKELDLLPENTNVKTAQSYLTRKYNVGKIVQEREAFRDIIVGHLQRTNKKLADIDEATLKADDIIDNIIGLGDKSMGISEFATQISTKSARITKARVFSIDDELIEDFLLSDADKLVSEYLYKGSALIRFNRYIKESGFENAGDLKKALKDDYRPMIEAAKTAKEKAKLSEQMEYDFKLLDDSVSILLGQFVKKSKAAPGLQVLRKYQASRLLGGVLLSSTPDIAMPILRHGLPMAVKHELLAMGRLMSGKWKTLGKESSDELRQLGIGIEHETNAILKALQDTDYVPSTTGSKVMDGLQGGADVLSSASNKLNGLAYWNSMWTRLSGQISMTRTHRALRGERDGGLRDVDLKRFLELGIDENMRKRMLKMFDKYGKHEDGLSIAGLDRWKDKEAAEILGAAIIKDVNTTILIPGKGNIPRIVQESEVAKTMFQFKSFITTASSAILIRGLQQRDARTLMGITALIGLGYVGSYGVRKALRGQEIETDIGTIITEGISRSGTGGLLGDLGLGMIGGNSRYQGVNAQSMIMGPSMNLIQDTVQAVQGPLDGDLSGADIKKIIRTLPLQNLFYIRGLLDQLGD